MKPAVALLGYLGLIFVGTAMLTPLVYVGLHTYFPWPFHRYVDRILMLSALSWLPLFWRWFGLEKLAALGIHFSGLPLRVAWGFLFGMLFSAVVLLAMLVGSWRIWTGWDSLSFLPGMMVGFLALAVAEEVLFRGLAQTVFSQVWGIIGGIVATAVLFAVMHFIKVPENFTPPVVHWWSGWQAIGLSWVNLWQGTWAGGHLVVLLLLSGLLSLVRLITRDLGLPIGLHAGLISGKGLIDRGTQPLGIPSYWNRSLEAHPFTQLFLLLLVVLLVLRYSHHVQKN